MAAKIAEYIRIRANMYYARARILRQSMANKYRIIDDKVGNEHRSFTENPMTHALSGQLPFG